MLSITEDGTIRLTRGDTARFTVQITNDKTNEPYVIGVDDTLTFSVKKTVNDVEAVLQKTVTGSDTLYIRPEDTSELSFTKYKYDVQLTTAGGDVFTVIGPSVLEILQEVTC